MRYYRASLGSLSGSLLILGLLAAGGIVQSASAAAPDINKYTTTSLKSMQLDSVVTFQNQAELKKISPDFANVYRLRKVTISYVQPGKLHLETVIMGAHVSYTINGNTRYTSIPTVHVHKVEDVSTAPGKKQTLLDSGLVPPELMNDWNATYLRTEGNLIVFQFSPKQPGETMKDIVFIDRTTRITVRRLNYDRDGKLVKWLWYKNPVQAAPGVYIPSRIEVYNTQNKLAAATSYRNIRVNVPINNAIFNF